MSGTVVEVGDKLHIMTRRLFEEDIRRHFVGEVMATSYALTATPRVLLPEFAYEG